MGSNIVPKTLPGRENYERLITRLTREADTLNAMISALQELRPVYVEAAKQVKKRGRKFMSPEDRVEVSERMKRYWAQRRETMAARMA